MTKIGRNAPCPCGSGKKYKKCCLEKDLAERRDAATPAATGPEWEEVENPEAQEFSDLAESPEVRANAYADEIDREEDAGHGTRPPSPNPRATRNRAKICPTCPPSSKRLSMRGGRTSSHCSKIGMWTR